MRREKRVVIDTNVLISGILLPSSTPKKALEIIFQNTTPIVSSETFRELHEKLALPKFDRYISARERQLFLRQLLSVSAFIPVSSTITDCRDPKDNKFLELAVDGSAEYIVSGDQDLLVLNPFRGISILSPQEFLDSFGQDEETRKAA